MFSIRYMTLSPYKIIGKIQCLTVSPKSADTECKYTSNVISFLFSGCPPCSPNEAVEENTAYAHEKTEGKKW